MIKTMKYIANMVRLIMFKIYGGVKIHEVSLQSISDHEAIITAQSFYRNNGFIGRYYCETETGKTFQINY